VIVKDQRRFDPEYGFRVNQKYLRDSYGQGEAFLRAAAGSPGSLNYQLRLKTSTLLTMKCPTA
jgi:hypothetical protein